MLVKSQIPTLDQMSKMDKEEETKLTIEEKNKIASKWDNLDRIEDVEESSSYSSISMHNINYDRKGSEVSSHQSPSLIEVQIPEGFHSSPPTEKNPSERHSIIQEEEDP